MSDTNTTTDPALARHGRKRRTGVAARAVAAGLIVIPLAAVRPASATTLNTADFVFAAGYQTWTVPDGVHSVTMDVIGGAGADGNNASSCGSSSSGAASEVKADVPVTPGQTLSMWVGGGGHLSGPGGTGTPDGLFAGGHGGGAGFGASGGGGGGGAASVVWTGTGHNDDDILVVGGGGAKRTPRLAAEYAADFNAGFIGVAETAERFRTVDAACHKAGRDPKTLTHSIAQVLCCGRTEAEVARRAAAIGREVDELRENGLAGSPAEVVEKLGRFAEIGTERVYLQVLDLSDLEHLELVASEVMAQL